MRAFTYTESEAIFLHRGKFVNQEGKVVGKCPTFLTFESAQSFVQVDNHMYCVMSSPLMVKKLVGFSSENPNAVVRDYPMKLCGK